MDPTVGGPALTGLSLLYPPGKRPSAQDLARVPGLGQGTIVPFMISHQPDAQAGWVELLSTGLTFDLIGLRPTTAPLPAIAHRYGLGADFTPEAMEAVTLVPGDHLRGGEAMTPVVRAMAGTACELARATGAVALVWHPARSAMAVEVFARAVSGWLDGGAFPAIGLTALVAGTDGALRSEGLAFFTGQELSVRLSPGTPRQAAGIAVRLIDTLVDAEPLHERREFTGPDGEQLIAEPSGDYAVIHISRAE